MSKTKKRKENIFKDPEAKQVFQKGIKYLALSLPFLFVSPIVVTIGFKALSKDNSYWLLILGCFLVLVTLVMMAQAFRLLLKSLFSR
jgi:hypothetical protein